MAHFPPQQIILAALRVYQVSLSRDHGWLKQLYPYGLCRFAPSCSQYAVESIKKYGVARGGWLAVKRVCKCNPYHPGGVDLVK